MGPKTRFSKQEIVNVAFDIAKVEGFSGVTARNVAKRLGSSVAPIYVNFETIDDLIAAVVQRVFAISDELVSKQKGDDYFANVGRASLAFAREYPVLFRELMLQPNQYMASYETLENELVVAMAEDDAMQNWSLAERKRLLLKMRVFQLGLSVMVANGHMPSWLSDREVEDLLMEIGDELMRVHQLKREESKK
ncbi:MAG: TetR/AcrR family transcriptional regulator [Firmicutes bacterium]|nr:TetR/AcrR family transcriptional regulator [Bacillota bacterium]